MKKTVAAALVVASIAAAGSIAIAGSGPATGINGSMHDINSLTGMGYKGDSLGRTCVFCHTPHNARTTDLQVPLWNHADNKLTSLSAYNWVAPLNLQITMNDDPLVGPSRLCMACHDGQTAVDSHGSAKIGDVAGTQVMTSSYTDALGATAKRYINDLTVTHPIGFQYDEAASKRGAGEIVDSGTGFITSVLDNNFNTNDRQGLQYTNKKIKDTLYAGWMTCATCHEVHNTINAKPLGTNSYNYFLYAREEGSAICLSCHVK